MGEPLSHIYFGATGIKDDMRKKSLLLHLAGPEVQDVFETWNDTGGADAFDNAIEKLTAYFAQKRNVPFLRHQFHQASQESSETVDSFVSRLRTLAKHCQYGELTDDMIRDQVVDHCSSARLRRCLLREQDLTLDMTLNLARVMEASESQALQMESTTARTSEFVNRISFKTASTTYGQRQKLAGVHNSQRNQGQQEANQGQQARVNERVCYHCDKPGHITRDCRCTRGWTCEKCGRMGHFAKMCKTKMDTETQNGACVDKTQAHYVAVHEPDSDDEYIF